MPQLSYGHPSVADLERQRKATREKIVRAKQLAGKVVFFLLLSSLSLYYYYEGQPLPHGRSWSIPLLLIPLVGMVLGIYYLAQSSGFQRKYVLKVLPLLVREEWPDTSFSPDNHLPEEDLLEAGILRGPADRYDGGRLFEGLFAGLPLRMSEVRAEEAYTVNKKGKTEIHYRTLFSGILLAGERYGHPGFSRISFRRQDWDITKELSGYFMGMASRPEIQIGTNDPHLGKLFEINSTEPAAARALVTEELLVTLKQLKDHGQATGTPEIVLTPTNLYVALPGEDFSLTPKLSRPVHQQVTTGAQRTEFQLLLKLVSLLAREPED